MLRDAKSIVGMIHVQALPGTPAGRYAPAEVIDQAVQEARLYAASGVDALMIENMHDRPYLNGAVGPEIVAAMTAVGCAVRHAVSLPLGVQVLAGANSEALAVALACGAQWVRVENFVFSHVADEGLMPTAAAGPLLRYQRQIGANGVRILADIKKKHSSHSITADVDLLETAHAAEFFGADGVIVTGTATGRPVDAEDLRALRGKLKIPVWVGSGVTPQQLPEIWGLADGFVVGSWFKQAGEWSNPIDRARVDELLGVARRLRGQTK